MLVRRSSNIDRCPLKTESIHNASPGRVCPPSAGPLRPTPNHGRLKEIQRIHAGHDSRQRLPTQLVHSLPARPGNMHEGRRQAEAVAASCHPDELPQVFGHGEAELAQSDHVPADATATGLAPTDRQVRSKRVVQDEELRSSNMDIYLR